MSPWTALAWVLVASIALSLGCGVAILIRITWDEYFARSSWMVRTRFTPGETVHVQTPKQRKEQP